MTHQPNHTLARAPGLRRCDVCKKFSLKAFNCKECDDYDECGDCVENAPKRWAALQASLQATQPGGVSSPPPAPAPVIDDPKVNAMNHLPTHPFVPAGIKKCDLCGATVKFAFHCKICPNYDECEACHNRLTIPVAIVQATVITTHEPHHGFDLREGLQKCGPCGKNLSDRKALRCKICPDYNECINCFNGIKVVQATATTQQRPAAKNEGLSTLAQVAETIKNQHETMENAQNMVQGLNNIMTIINNLSNN